MIRKKLIEVALPLEAINKASAKEKSIRHGHPSTLHLWWARRPLATCRAILFSSLVDDPSCRSDLTAAEIEAERERLFRLVEKLVLWENVNNEAVLREAHEEILKSTNGKPPAIYDPFCGGGSIPLEAQRLGLEAHASDLNPVAVLITKALIEIPPKFAGQAPVNPEAELRGLKASAYPGAKGLAEDVRYYGTWMRDRAEERIGHLYPKAKLTDGSEATVVAWLWARTVHCPNPACGAAMPLVRSFQLSSKPGKQVWSDPQVDHVGKTIRFKVRTGYGTAPPGTVGRHGARCLVCGGSVPLSWIRAEGKLGKISSVLFATVIEGKRGRTYLDPIDEHARIALASVPEWAPDTDLPEKALGFRVQAYGMTKHRQLFTSRQLVALGTLSGLVEEARQRAMEDGASIDYANAISTYLGMGVSRLSDSCNSLCTWKPSMDQSIHLFTKQAVPMVWDFAESNVFAHAAGDFGVSLSTMIRVIQALPAAGQAFTEQISATAVSSPAVYSTDPPYYDNIGYSDLSDFFYVWLSSPWCNPILVLARTVKLPYDGACRSASVNGRSRKRSGSRRLRWQRRAVILFTRS